MTDKETKAKDLVDHYMYRAEFAPDWVGLQIALYDEGFTMSEVYNVMNEVREEGVYS